MTYAVDFEVFFPGAAAGIIETVVVEADDADIYLIGDREVP